MNRLHAFLMAVLCVSTLTGRSPARAKASTGADRIITSRSAGRVRLGMTVAGARKALHGYKLQRTSDGDGVALIGVSRGGREIMTLYAGEADPAARIDEKARVELIQVTDPLFHTASGVHPGMRLGMTERRLGRVMEIVTSEIEQREYANFSHSPAGMTFQVDAPSGTAGRYRPGSSPAGPRSTRAYVPSARIHTIIVRGK